MNEQNQNKSKSLPGLAVRQQAAKALDYVLQGNGFEPMGAEQIEDGRDRALVNRLVNVALRRHGHLNVIIAKLMQRGVPKRSGLFEAILRIGLVQLLFLPDVGDHSAIHLAVEGAKRDQRAARFDRVLNGVLRQAQRDAEKWKNLGNIDLFPDWLVKTWSRQYGKPALEGFGQALIEGAALDICLAKNDAELIKRLNGKKLVGNSVRIGERDRPVAQMEGFENGDWWVQDVAATLAAQLFCLKRKATVLDMCAAPGGKTAQLINRGFDVSALDNSPGRIKRLEQNLARLNMDAKIIEGDARTFNPPRKFDGVLIDAPCTATGTFRRHPEVVWHRQQKDLESRVALQKEIIFNGVNCLNWGGELILCVCSLQYGEGEAQANWVMHNFPQLQPKPISAKEIGGLSAAISPEGWVRTHPGLQIGDAQNTSMDGFFIARWSLG